MNNMDLVQLQEKICQKISREISDAYHNGSVDELLKKYGLEDETEHFYDYDYNNSNIIVIGNSKIRKNDLENVARQLGINPRRIKFELDYEKLTNYNFEKFKYNKSYSDILIGPMPHKIKGLDASSSFLAMVREQSDIFPKVIELRDSNELKITLQTFRKGLLKTRLYNEI